MKTVKNLGHEYHLLDYLKGRIAETQQLLFELQLLRAESERKLIAVWKLTMPATLHRGQIIKILPTTARSHNREAVPDNVLAVTCGKTGKWGHRIAVYNGCYFTIQGPVLLRESP